MNIAAIFGPVLLAGLALLSPSARAGEGLEQVFPSGTLLFATIDDRAAMSDALAASSWGRLFHDAAFEGLRGALDAKLSAGGDAFLATTGVDPSRLLGALDGGLAFGVLAAADPERQEFDPENDFVVSLGFVAEVSGDVDDFAATVDGLVDRMLEDDDDLVLKSERYGDVDAGLVVDEKGVSMRYGFVDGHLVVTVNGPLLEDRDDFGALVDGVLGVADEVLADDPEFAGSLAAEPLTGVRASFDLMAFLRFASAFEPQVTDALEALTQAGGDVGRLAATFAVGAQGLDLSFEIRQQVPESQLAMLLDQQPVAARFMPPTVRGAMALQMDWAAYYDQLVSGLMKQDPDAAREMISSMGDFEEQYGFHPRDDLIENLDGQVGLFVAEVDESEQLPLPLDDAPPLNVALVAGLRDGESLRTLIDDVVRKTGSHAVRRSEEFEGRVIDLVPLPGAGNLAWSVTDDLLVVSGAPSLVRDVLRRQGESKLESLATSEAYRAASARVPERRSFELSFAAADLGRLVLAVLHSIQDDQQQMHEWLPDEPAGALVGIELPDGDLVARYVKGAGLVTATTEPERMLFRVAWP
ncbi:MAG: hypothetical protein H6825_13245 [Planctomycetes bacterium]|nr:hypothetical protein [Planctomycetota bacterium]